MSRNRPARPVLAGNSHAAVRVLDLLLEAWTPDALLVIAPRDGERHPWQPSLAVHARARGVSVLTPGRVNDEDVVDRLRDHDTDLLLSVYYTQIFHPALLDVVAGPALNVHPSLLPRHRGTAPLIWAIAEGDAVAGVTVHHLTEGIDTGPIVRQWTLPIHPDDTGYTLHVKAAHLVCGGMAEILRGLVAGRPLQAAREPSGSGSYHSKRGPQLNHLDWSQPRARIRDVVRALAAPLPGAYAMFGEHEVRFDEVCVVDPAGPARPPGTVDHRTIDGSIIVWAADGPLRVDACRVDGAVTGPDDLRTLLAIADGVVAR